LKQGQRITFESGGATYDLLGGATMVGADEPTKLLINIKMWK